MTPMNPIADDRLAVVVAACEKNPAVARQVTATLHRPLRTIPSSWWLPETAEAMSDWMRRFAPQAVAA